MPIVIPPNFDYRQFESMYGFVPLSDDGATITNATESVTQEAVNAMTIQLDPDWTGLRQALYLSNDWYRVKNAAPAVASELMLLLWNYQQDPSLESEIVGTISALKVAANVTEDEKLAIAAIMEIYHIPQTFIDVVLGG